MPFGGLRLPELLIILAIVVLLFGIGRIGKVGKELGGAIREFRKGLSDGDKDKTAEDESSEPSEKQ